MLDLISRRAQGHGPVHILLISAADLRFASDGAERGWVRVSLPPLRMMTGPVQHFYSFIWDAWRFNVLPFCVGAFGTDSFLARQRRKKFLVDFVVKRMVMVTCSGSVPFTSPPSPFSTFGIFLSLLTFCPLIAATGLDACFGMVGCLVSMASVLKHSDNLSLFRPTG